MILDGIQFVISKLPGRKSKYLCIYDIHQNQYRPLARFLGEAQADEYCNTMEVIRAEGRIGK